MEPIETWRNRHPEYNNSELLESLRAEHPERQIWVGDEPEQLSSNPKSPESFYEELLNLGYGVFKDRPILPSRVLSDAITDITVYSLSRSIKDPEDVSESMMERSLTPRAITFLNKLFELLEQTHESGAHTNTMTAYIDNKLADLNRYAIRVYNRIDDSIPSSEFCNMVWREAIETLRNTD